jgi:hypothetical protein
MENLDLGEFSGYSYMDSNETSTTSQLRTSPPKRRCLRQ